MSHGPARPRSLFRRHGSSQAEAKVGMAELFFDLVFVFAVTQLSHTLLERPTPLGALQTLMLLLAVWSLWHYAVWATNVLDPLRIPVRLLLFALMLAGLVVSMTIPSAFAGGAWGFALGYVLMHTVRGGFMLWAAHGEASTQRRSYQRNLFWIAATAPLWFIGAASSPEPRLWWWLAAIVIEFISPWLLYWTPWLGASKTSDWAIDGSHIAERCALFVIIALGESLLITGSTFARQTFSAAGAAGFAAAFVGTAAMWWIYFHEGAEHAVHRIAHSSDPGRTARIAYSYLHIAIVAGIIVSAVGDEIVLVHPEHADAAAIAVLIGGPALFVLGCSLFKWISYERRAPPLSHSVGLLALAVLAGGALAHWFSTLQLGLATTGVLLLVALWETLALRRR